MFHPPRCRRPSRKFILFLCRRCDYRSHDYASPLEIDMATSPAIYGKGRTRRCVWCRTRMRGYGNCTNSISWNGIEKWQHTVEFVADALGVDRDCDRWVFLSPVPRQWRIVSNPCIAVVVGTLPAFAIFFRRRQHSRRYASYPNDTGERAPRGSYRSGSDRIYHPAQKIKLNAINVTRTLEVS